MQLVQLRFRAVCDSCGSKLPPRSEAWQDEEANRTICPTCQRLEAHGGGDIVGPPPLQDDLGPVVIDLGAHERLAPPPPPPPPPPGPLVVEDDPRHEAVSRNGPQSRKLPRVGPSLAAGLEVDKQIGDEDLLSNSIGRALEAARPHGLEILRSRPWGGTRVDTEDVVIAPSGVWIVDGLGSPDQPVEKGFLSGHAGAELLNVVGGRTSIISGLLFDSPYQWVPVRGALVFDGKVPGWFDEPFGLAGISITTPRALIDSLFTPLNLDADTRTAVAEHLSHRF